MFLKRYVRVLLLATLFSFIWGLWWGYRKIEMRDPIRSARIKLKVLAPEGYLSDKIQARLLRERKIHLEVTEVRNANEFLKRINSASESYDLVFFSSFLVNSLAPERYFLPLSSRSHAAIQRIAFDFLNLSYDPDNKYTIPLLWGVNGFLARPSVDAQKFSIAETFKDVRTHSTASLLGEPAEIFTFLRKIHPIVSTWVDTGQGEAMRKEVRDMNNLLRTARLSRTTDFSNNNIVYYQLSNGVAADFVDGKNWQFILPEDRANLWLLLVAIGKNANDVLGAEAALNIMTDLNFVLELSKSTKEAVTLTALNDSKAVHEMRKAKYIRALPLSRIEFFSRHEVYEPTFMEYLREDLKIHK